MMDEDGTKEDGDQDVAVVVFDKGRIDSLSVPKVEQTEVPGPGDDDDEQHLLVPKPGSDSELPAPMMTQTDSNADPVGEWSFREALVCSLNYNISISSLCFAYNLSREGALLGVFMLFVSSLVTLLTAQMIGAMMSRDETIRSYADIGARAMEAVFPEKRWLSTIAASATRAFQLLELFCYLVFTVKTVEESLEALHVSPAKSSIASFGLMSSSLLFLKPRAVAAMSTFGNLCFIFVLLLLFVHGLLELPRNEASLRPIVGTTGILDSFAGILLLFAGHAVYPSSYRGLKNKKEYSEVVNVTFVALLSILLVFGFVMTFAFGSQNKELPTGTLQDLPRTNLLGQTLLTGKLISLYPVLLYPIVTELRDILKMMPPSFWKNLLSKNSAVLETPQVESKDEIETRLPDEEQPRTLEPLRYGGMLVLKAEQSVKKSAENLRVFLRHNSIAFFVTGVSFLVSLAVPNLTFAMSFVGSVFASSLAVTFPSLFYLMMFGNDEGEAFKLAAPLIFLFGLFSSLATTCAVFNN